MEEQEVEIKQSSVRFSTAPWYSPGTEVIVGGLGTIGSWAAFFLGRQDCELHIYDFDMVNEVNMAGQLYNSFDALEQIKKVDGTKRLIENFSNNTNVYTYDKYEKETGLASAYMFSCFDSIDARKVMFEKYQQYLKDNPEEDCIFIDARLSAENFDVFFVTRDKIKQYQEDLYSAVEIEELPCSFKATSHCGAMCASMMISGFNNFISNIKMKENIREVPFRVSVQLSNLIFDIK